MFLRSLTLKGFKSFAESTTLEFQPGLNVVVGPNGSGKSNIVDAVAWVLGAQGPRAVRSARMDDVIFAGTGRRAALGRAEVSLTIDNSAGLLAIDLSEVTITRTLFRASGESEYALNGVACRLLDVQELLSDSGVGRQQHVIVSQGNLDAVLDTRPEDRRLIVEEAAGILKFRRRKEKAERRLEGTEANLVRLSDLFREVGRQLRPLERQADAARRHGSLVDELAALQLFLRGRELAALGARSEAAVAGRTTLVAEEARVRSELLGLDSRVAAAESSLATAGGSGLADAVGRLEALRERARGLLAVLAERRRSVQKDLHSAPDLVLIAKLESDSDLLNQEIAAVEAEIAERSGPTEALAAEEAALAVERSAQATVEPRTDHAAEARGELVARRAGLERGAAEMARLAERVAELTSTLAEITGQRERDATRLDAAVSTETEAVAAAEAAGAERRRAEEALESARSEVRAASDEHRRWKARAQALAETIGRAGGDGPGFPGSIGDIEGRPGVIGVLLGLVDLDPGHEAAFEAALSGALDTLVVADAEAARALVEDLVGEGRDLPENVLALGAVTSLDGSGQAPPNGCKPFGDCVRSSDPAVKRALDILLASTVLAGDASEAMAAAAGNPGVVAVTLAGARFSSAGWRLGAGRAGATLAALAEATVAAERSAADVEAAEAHHAVAVADHAQTVALADTLERSASSATTDRQALADADRHRNDQSERTSAAIADASGAMDRSRASWAEDAARVAELEAILPGLESEEAESAQRAAAAAAVRLRLQERADELSGRRAEIEARSAELDERHRQLARRLQAVTAHLGAVGADGSASEARRGDLERLVAQISLLMGQVERRLADIDSHLLDVRTRRDRHAQAVAEGAQRLEALRSKRHGEERRLEEVRERVRRVELEEAEARMRTEAAVEALRRELDTEPEAALVAECPDMPAGSSPTSRARELERELRLMGQVNPLALEELAALQERHAFLSGQLDDVKSSRRELARVIRAVEAEMTELLAAAYADVEEHFAKLFETLFPGGSGRLTLTDPEHILESGIEVDARPAGKNVRKLSLLSGGERSLVALAFLFAVFRSRPSPFYLLDEVEAALDDLNLHRFVDLLDEFRAEAQLLVVTHQKRTMEAADCLYGVTMQPGGSSRVLSERVREPA